MLHSFKNSIEKKLRKEYLDYECICRNCSVVYTNQALASYNDLVETEVSYENLLQSPDFRSSVIWMYSF